MDQTRHRTPGIGTTGSTVGNFGRALLPLVVPVLLLAAWQVASVSGALPPRILPAPLAVVAAAKALIVSGDLWRHLSVSAARAFLGLAVGGGIGFALGLLTGASKWAETFLDGTVQMLRAIPNLALLPFVIIWFGIGEEAKTFLIAFGVFFPLYLNTYHGIRSVDPDLVEMARAYGVRGAALFWHVLLPGATPSVLVGLRFALGSMWLTLIAAEALAAQSGIGYLTTTAREFMQTDVVLVGALLYALLGKAADTAVRLLERVLLRWQTARASN
ncbi:MAG: ABC transporter permease subunit [Armatimonadetes bacterium]|nr:ABC transporter permease subunit [Armatimonadota bacterium]